MRFEEFKRILDTYGVVTRTVIDIGDTRYTNRRIKYAIKPINTKYYKGIIVGRSDSDLQSIINLWDRLRLVMIATILNIEE